MYLMSGKTVLITGGTRGIGAVTAKAFLEKGYRVVSNYVHDDVAAQSFRNETSIPIYKWDVADPRGIADIVLPFARGSSPEWAA
jgi:acetoacetyl-CoA reductase